MSIYTGSAANYTALLDALNAALLEGHALSIAWGGAGNGVLSALRGKPSSVQETITVTWTSATAFNVVGSVTGSMGSGTVGSQFSHARLSFTATAGGTPWANGSTAQFVMTPPWTALRSSVGSEYIWRAPGDGGADQIFVGAKVFSNVSADYYNWRLGGFTGYTAGAAFEAQPGAMTDPVVPLWNSAIPYWFMISGKRAIVVAKVSTVYEMAYMGFLDSYASPGQWSYPLAVGGSMSWYSEPAASSANWRWSYAGNEHRGFPFGGPMNSGTNRDKDSPLRVRKPDGTWRGFSYSDTASVGTVWPYAFGMSDVRACLDGSYPVLPVSLAEDMGAAENPLGELAGVVATTGFSNASENTITQGRASFLVSQNIHRTTKTDYAAFRLD